MQGYDRYLCQTPKLTKAHIGFTNHHLVQMALEIVIFLLTMRVFFCKSEQMKVIIPTLW